MATTKVRGTQVSNVALLDAANIFTANQRVNAGLGINVAPGATGEIKTSAGLYTFGRSVADGIWTVPAFNAANFTGAGSMTWTVQAGDVSSFAYTFVNGKTMVVVFCIATTTVGGTPSGALQIAIPGGFTAVRQSLANTVFMRDNNVKASGYTLVQASGTTIYISRSDEAAFSLSTNLTDVFGQIEFEVV